MTALTERPCARPGRRWRSAAGTRAAMLVLLAVTTAAVAAQAPPPAAPPDRSHTERLSQRAATRITALRREADALAARERTLLDDLRRLEVERDLRTVECEQSARDLAAIEHDLGITAARLDTLESRSRAESPALAARLVDVYKLGKAGYARLLLGVDSLRETGRAYRFVSALQQIDRLRVTEHGRTLTALKAARTALEDRQRQQLATQAQMSQAKADADAAARAQTALVQRIDERRDLAAQLMGELQAAHDHLQARMAQVERGADAAAGGVITLPVNAFRGDLDWPIDGRVLTGFGRQRHPRFNTATVSNGVRIAAAAGTPVRAIHDGTVVFAEAFVGFGNLVIVDHGGQAFTMYGTLAELLVAAGTHVSHGQVVGASGASPEGVASIYFELRVDGKPVDPLQWLRKK